MRLSSALATRTDIEERARRLLKDVNVLILREKHARLARRVSVGYREEREKVKESDETRDR